MKKLFISFIKLDKFYKMIAIRYSKGIFYLINLTFGIFAGVLYYYSLKFILTNHDENGVSLLLGSLGIIFFAELLNISSKNSFISIYTLDRIDIYPISKLKHLKNLFLSDLFHSRATYHSIFLFVIFFFFINITIYTVLQTILIFISLYFISTAIFTLIDYGYACLVKYFGKKAAYSVLVLYLLIFSSISILDKLNINIDKFSTFPTHLVKYLLNR